MVKRWVRINCKKDSALNVELELTEEDGKTVPMYRFWPGDCPEPPGNPMKIKPETLRKLGYKPEDE